MKNCLGLAASIAAISSPARAEEPSVGKGPLPAWVSMPDLLPVPDGARGPVFVRRQVVENHIDRNGQSSFISTTVRIQDASALSVGNIAIVWNPAAGKPVIHAVSVSRNGVKRDVLAQSGFTILRREEGLESAKIDGLLTATMTVPDLRVGDDLEITYTLPSHDPTLKTESAGLLMILPSPSPGRFDLRVSWDKGFAPTVRPTADISGIVQTSERSVRLAMDNPGALNPPKDAPTRYSWQRIIEYSRFADWTAMSARISPLFSKAAVLSKVSPVKAEAAAIAAASTDPRARAEAALKLVQQQVRYIYVGLNGANLTPTSAEETWQRRYGDCKAKTVLLLALLNELGINAKPVLVNNGGGDDSLDTRLPNPAFFDHVLVQADIDGRTYWLDGTLPDAFGPSETAALPYRWVLPVAASGADIVPIPWTPETKPNLLSLFEVDARAGFDQPARIVRRTITRGLAGLVEYYQFIAVSDDQLQNAFKQNLEGTSSWNKVDKVTWRFDPKEHASVLEITGSGSVDWDTDGASRSLALPGGGFSPPERRQRGAGAESATPFLIKPDFDCNVTTLRLPGGTSPSDWSFNTTYETRIYGQSFRRSFEKRDSTIRMIRANRTLMTELPAADAEKDTAKLASFDNSMAWAYYKYDTDTSNRSGESVPATYEGDWVADSTACLVRTFTKQ